MERRQGNALWKSINSVITNGKNARRAYDDTWRIAARAPIFCKISKRTMADGKTKKFYRTARLIGSHAYNIAASGAALRACRILGNDCERLRVEYSPENSRAPWLPPVSKGAKMVVEQFLAALAQEAAFKGHVVRKCVATKRLNKAQCRLGWDATVDSVAGLSALVPKGMIALPLATRAKAVRAKPSAKPRPPPEDDEEYAPPEEGHVEDLQPEDEEPEE